MQTPSTTRLGAVTALLFCLGASVLAGLGTAAGLGLLVLALARA